MASVPKPVGDLSLISIVTLVPRGFLPVALAATFGRASARPGNNPRRKGKNDPGDNIFAEERHS